MNKFELSPVFLIGHEKIDSDHVLLVDILNEMVGSFILGSRDICLQKWRKFCEKLERHFTDEMDIMTGFGYSSDEHIKNHQKILARVKLMGKADNTLDDWEVCLFDMRNDLLSQILKHDLLFAEHLITIGYNEI